ncbi:MAG: hypothetical protein WBD40_10905 [Tepidisphaeraceae bacterium]
MRGSILTCGLLLLGLAGGCGSRFAGEWVEEGSYDQQGVFREATGQRRLALKFEPPSTVRYGTLVHRAGAVDHQSVQMDTYMTLQNREVAEFGSVIARVDRGRLVATIGGDIVTVFARVRGKSVFPPAAVLPSLAKASETYKPEVTPVRQEALEALAAAP